MIVGLMLVIGGLVLLTGSLYLIPALGKQLEKLAKWLGGFQALIGVVAIVVALIEWEDLYSIVLVIVGLILAVSIMALLPAVGKYIAKFVKALGGVQTAVGVIALIGGIWNLID